MFLPTNFEWITCVTDRIICRCLIRPIFLYESYRKYIKLFLFYLFIFLYLTVRLWCLCLYPRHLTNALMLILSQNCECLLVTWGHFSITNRGKIWEARLVAMADVNKVVLDSMMAVYPQLLSRAAHLEGMLFHSRFSSSRELRKPLGIVLSTRFDDTVVVSQTHATFPSQTRGLHVLHKTATTESLSISWRSSGVTNVVPGVT